MSVGLVVQRPLMAPGSTFKEWGLVTLLEQNTGAGAVPDEGTPRTPDGALSPQPASRPDAGDISSYTRTVGRSLWGALVGAVLGGLLAGALLLGNPTYTAVSVVTINPLAGAEDSGSQAASELIDPPTEIEVAESDQVLELAVDKYGPLDVEPADLREAVNVTAIDASTVLQIAVTADKASEAQREADAVARAYLYYRADVAGADQGAAATALQAKIAAADAARQAAGARFKAAEPQTAERRQALADHHAALDRRNQLQAQLASLQDLEAAGGTVLRSAQSVPTTTNPSPKLVVISAVVGGAVIGFIVAFLLAQLGTRVRRLEDLEKVPGLRFIAAVPKARSGRHEGSAEVFRAAREQRKIDGWPEAPYSTVFALDLRRGPGLAAPLGVAQALAQEHGSATLLALGWEPGADHESELEALGFRPVGDHHYATADNPSVSLRTFRRNDSGEVSDTYLTNEASAALDSLNSSPSPIVVWCAEPCGEATRLAVLSRSDTLLLVLEPRQSRISLLRQVTSESVSARVAWVGALLVR